ncbi:SCAN domain-containing protein 3-like [Macrobrachium nipponense]|uniref:SCAN domain-containing protein 3-like n=1 Tax=Macrobrachium nipponense TaxID=159736 RepID=UPI0030C8B4E0
MLASYKIANLIAKAGKPHTIGESLIMPAVAVVLSTVMNQSPQEVNDFSLQLDESTLPDNSALLMAFVRFLDVDEICQEMLFALKLTTDTKGESIFKKLEVYFEENNIPLKNIVACATDGAAAMIGSGTELGQKLVDAKSDIFLYLSDIFEKLNVLNKELQGNNSTMFSCKEAITTFKGKLKLFWLNLGRREFAQFPSLAVISTDLLDDDLAVYVDHLKQLHNDMDTRFSDLLQMTVPHWFVDPFIADVSEVDVTLQESLIELQNNTTAQARFKRGGHQKLWMNQDVYKKYPILWKDVKLLLLAFPTSYLVETGFSRVMYCCQRHEIALTRKKRRFTSLSDSFQAKH